jgi:hypothetical protein
MSSQKNKLKPLNTRRYLSPISVDEGSDIRVSASQLNRSSDAYVIIRDCSRSVTLGFYFDDEKSKKKRMSKINTLIAELSKLRDWMQKVEV